MKVIIIISIWILTLLFSTSHAAILAGPIPNPANGHDYYLLSSQGWLDAENESQSLGGHLATIRSLQENTWVTEQFSSYGGTNRYLWIGLNDITSEGVFEWTSGETVAYTNWDSGEPNNVNGIEDAVYIFSPGETARFPRWNDFDPETELYAIAEVSLKPIYLNIQSNSVFFTSASSTLYRIESISNLVSGSWSTYTNLSATGTNGVVNILTDEDSMYFRGWEL
ncbi:lectin-like protein [Pontiella sulfatireligans]|uniref:C-type lectin domain-containing protein n=1 Tax=Pontiella sulfatireligans TaxID=2750658 RepID=A0A6C2ULI2_9BACT|nr:lectin-like protein [Pontiella sulfatireligans]VGO20763.1 hypothetical protein SCARR_02830 [Pontiella sulfatireligans]